MTDMPEHEQESLERWLAGEHRDLHDGLSRFLDLNAGLRAVTALQTGHASVLSGLASHLNAQAGLAAILSPPAPTVSPSSSDLAEAIRTADPAIRMALRRDPVTLAVILSDLAVRFNEIPPVSVDRDFAHDLNRARHRAHAFDRDVALAIDSGLDHRSDPPTGLIRAVNRSAIDRALDHSNDLPIGLDVARGLARGLARALDRTRNLDLDLDLDLQLALDRDLNHACNLSFRLNISVLNPSDAIRDIAQLTAIAVGRVLSIGERVEGLAAALLDGVLDDFTDADLSHIEAGNRHLTGVRWSERGTIWPQGTDKEALRARSQKVPGSTDVWEITGLGGKEPAHPHVLV